MSENNPFPSIRIEPLMPDRSDPSRDVFRGQIESPVAPPTELKPVDSKTKPPNPNLTGQIEEFDRKAVEYNKGIDGQITNLKAQKEHLAEQRRSETRANEREMLLAQEQLNRTELHRLEAEKETNAQFASDLERWNHLLENAAEVFEGKNDLRERITGARENVDALKTNLGKNYHEMMGRDIEEGIKGVERELIHYEYDNLPRQLWSEETKAWAEEQSQINHPSLSKDEFGRGNLTLSRRENAAEKEFNEKVLPALLEHFKEKPLSEPVSEPPKQPDDENSKVTNENMSADKIKALIIAGLLDPNKLTPKQYETIGRAVPVENESEPELEAASVIEEEENVDRNNGRRVRGLTKLVGATAMGVLAGTVGATTIGWAPTAVVLGAAQSGIRRLGEIRKSEGLAQIMTKEWDSNETVSGRFKGARRLLAAYVNAENVAGVWGTRVMNRLFEVGDPEAEKCRDFLAEIVQRGGERNEILAGMRGFFGEEEAAIRRTESTDDSQINERVAQQLALITSQSWWEQRMGSYKIFDILKKQGVAVTREQVDQQMYFTYAAFNDLCSEYIDRLPDSDFKNSLIQKQSEERSGRYRTLMATYFVAGTAMGAVKALDVASFFHLDQLGKGFEAWRGAFSPHPIVAAAPVSAEIPVQPKVAPAVTPETVGGTLTEVKSGDTWGGLLKEKHGYSGPELWGTTLKSGEVWSSGYVDALADPRNAQQIIDAGHTAAAAYPEANAVLTGLGIDINAGTIDTAKLTALKLGLSSSDAGIREMALRFTKYAATVLRPGNIYLK